MEHSNIGLFLSQKYHQNVKKEWKYAFLAAFIIGLLVHFYKFSNTLLNHDSVFNFYDSQNMVGSGRWLLSAACSLSSFFDLPWVTGLLSLVFLSLTAVVVVDLFEIKNPVVIVLTGGLLVSFPAVTDTLFFGFTSDGYFISMFLAALAARLQRVDDKKIFHLIISALLICCSCGIYQAYVSFAAILLICHFILYIMDNTELKISECFKWIGRQIINFGAGLALYYVIWKVCLKLEHFTATSYQGIDSLKFSFGTIFSAIPAIIKSFVQILIEWNVFEHGWTVYGVLNVVFVIIAAAVLIYSVIKTKLYRQKIKLLLMVICCGAVPFVAYMWRFTSETVSYGYRMLASLFVILVFVLILADRYYNKYLGTAVAVLLAVIIFNNGINANIAYFHLEKENKNTFATACEMISRINQLDTDTRFLYVTGDNLLNEAYNENDYFMKTTPTFANSIEKSFFYNYEHFVPYINGMFNGNYKKIDMEKAALIEDSPEAEMMGVWPEKNSIQIIDEVIVIKIAEANTTDCLQNEP